MIPFSISCRVPGGVVCARLEDLRLDGILAYAVLRDRLGEAFWSADHPRIEPALPLARRQYGDTWYWCVSSAQGEAVTRDIHYWHRRFDTHESHRIDFAGRRGKINTEGGPMRDMRGALQVLYPERLTWYALGDPGAVFALVQTMPFIGKMHGMGEGRAWWLEPEILEEDRSVWDGPTLMRPIPAEEAAEAGGSYEYEYRAIRPPHWDPANQCLCAVRGQAA